jgi:hypothetical protein
VTIEETIAHGLGDELWNSDPYRILRNHMSGYALGRDVHNSLVENPNLSMNGILSLAFYTSDVRRYGGAREDNIYWKINTAFKSGESAEISRWNPFFFYLNEAKRNLPKHSAGILLVYYSMTCLLLLDVTLYRGIDKRICDLSPIYQKEDSFVTWTSFTSTTTDAEVVKRFSPDKVGTWMVIKGVPDGITIPFSLFPSEKEVLLFPNTTLKVKSILLEEFKDFTGAPKVDFIYFTWVPMEI